MQPLSALGKGMGRHDTKDQAIARSRQIFSKGFKSVERLKGTLDGKKLIVCGSGPSLKETVKDIRRQRKLSKKVLILALNKSDKYLRSLGICPDYTMMIDPKPWLSTYTEYDKRTDYILGDKVSPETYEKFIGKPNVYVARILEYDDEPDLIKTDIAQRLMRRDVVSQDEIASARLLASSTAFNLAGSTVLLRALPLFYELGCRNFELHGVDSSIEEQTHVVNKNVPTVDIFDETLRIDGKFEDGSLITREYRTNTHMARQFKEFFDWLDEINKFEIMNFREPMVLKVAGYGALPFAVALKYTGMHVDEKINADPMKMRPPYKGIENGRAVIAVRNTIEISTPQRIYWPPVWRLKPVERM